MSDRRSPTRQPSPKVARLAGSDRGAAGSLATRRSSSGSHLVAPPAVSPVVLVLVGVLALLLWLKLSGTHLAAAQRLGVLIGSSPLPALTTAQLGKLIVLAGVALLGGGAILLALQWPNDASARRLALRCLWLLALGAIAVIILDLAPAVWPRGAPAYPLHLAEAVVKWTVLAGCAALLWYRLMGQRIKAVLKKSR